MKFFEIIPSNTKFDFVSKFKPAIALSSILVVGVFVLLATKGLNYGVDFTGGTVLQLKFPSAMTTEQVREELDKMGAKDASVVAIQGGQTEFLITNRSLKDVAGATPLQTQIEAKFGKGVIQQADVVGPRVGAELKASAIKSLFYSLLLIMVYIWFRFDIRFAPGATIALVHDMLMAVGFYILSGHEFNITAIAALLTIAGYGVNDTIVIYDHVRDLFKNKNQAIPLPVVINEAVNKTLSRTCVTALLVLLSLIPIAIFCEGELKDFALAMIVGVFLGSYSTFFIAAPMTIAVDKFLAKREKNSAGRPKTVTA